ncbi:MAG: hypothetical protein JWM85_1687 [Acidimicrobiaceae bacterium]|nr:hypothetical protein [Acidimicrobiaceae bacterium]
MRSPEAKGFLRRCAPARAKPKMRQETLAGRAQLRGGVVGSEELAEIASLRLQLLDVTVQLANPGLQLGDLVLGCHPSLHLRGGVTVGPLVRVQALDAETKNKAQAEGDEGEDHCYLGSLLVEEEGCAPVFH